MSETNRESAGDHDCRVSSWRKEASFTSPYHFVESGLPNVYLVGTDYYVCKKCGKQSADIPALTDLMVKIGRAIVRKTAPLDCAEIRFLRKRIGKNTAEFAKIIGVAREEVSRWEHKEHQPSHSADKLIRVFYCLSCEDDELRAMVNKHVETWLATLPGEDCIASLRAKLHELEWTVEAVSV
jgi:putative zinc finger/helix-turn-helix YgiT family protein